MHAPSPPARTRPRFVVPALVAGVLAMLAGGTGVAGGFRATAAKPPDKPGKAVDVERFEVTVRDARIITAGALGLGTGTQRFLAVRLRVANKGDDSASLGLGGLTAGIAARTKDGKWLRPDAVDGVAAGSRTDAVQPGMAVEATAKWRMGPADAPRTFTVGLRKWEKRPGFTDTDVTWRPEPEDDKLEERVTLAVAGA
ncbi:hypothetical protein [Actinomadura hibisca]|uniref:hypothetical protein n=1 Tax=Actinomadura hibisca TaxID=68565 RepID=UPI0008329569|nr:hypothetical protein [Actinomadura hibisca]